MEVTFFVPQDAIWFEFNDMVFEREEHAGDGVAVHYGKR